MPLLTYATTFSWENSSGSGRDVMLPYAPVPLLALAYPTVALLLWYECYAASTLRYTMDMIVARCMAGLLAYYYYTYHNIYMPATLHFWEEEAVSCICWSILPVPAFTNFTFLIPCLPPPVACQL